MPPMPRFFTYISCLLTITFLSGCGSSDNKDPFPNAELVVELKRVKNAKPMTADEAKPYDEALVYQQYEVVKVVKGKLSKKVKQLIVGQWCVVAEEDRAVDTGLNAVTTLPLEPKDAYPGIREVKSTRPEDADPGLQEFIEAYRGESKVPKSMRMDYGGIFSRHMKAYWELRPQLKCVIIGNSHTGVGVEPGKLMQPENGQVPCVVSLAAPGSHMPFQCLLTREYALDLPKLEWVVWGVSTRSFNKERTLNRRMDAFMASAGRKYDELHWKELWPVPASAPQTMADLTKKGFDGRALWEYWSEKKERSFPVPIDDKTRQFLLKEMGKENSVWWEEAWTEFDGLVKQLTAKGVKVMLFTPPVHPVSKESVAVDADQTSHADLKILIEKLSKLDADNDKVWFHDVNNGGNHDFAHEDFFDIDHLWPSGSDKLTKRLADWMSEVDKGQAK